MAPRSADEQQNFDAALAAIAREEPLTEEHQDALSLSLADDGDVEAFRDVWSKLSAPARARAIRSLRNAAEARLRLDYSALNLLALADADPQVRIAGIEAALEDRGPALFQRLLQMVQTDPVGAVRRAAAEDLARFALFAELEDLDQPDVAALRTTLFQAVRNQQEEPGVRQAALGALGYFSDEAVAEELAAGFGERDLRVGAVRGMGRSADPRWTDRLLPVLGSEDPDLRAEAAKALGEIEEERAVGPLAELVDDPDEDVRVAAVHALAVIGGEEAREALLYLLEDPNQKVRDAAEHGISNLETDEDDGLDT
ncbi:MAG: HEAT repeat domain-containing protein [Chloroflexi bacterium]|nr:HEAT repeat domain-containing protein [Chloroflexota bacterium]